MAKPGDRIRLIKMGPDDPDPIAPGATGTVLDINRNLFGRGDQLVVEWDNGRSLALVSPPDLFEVIDNG